MFYGKFNVYDDSKIINKTHPINLMYFKTLRDMIGDCYDFDFTKELEEQISNLSEEELQIKITSNENCIHQYSLQFIMELCDFLIINKINPDNFDDKFTTCEKFINDKLCNYCSDDKDKKFFYISVLNILDFLNCDNGFDSEEPYVMDIMCRFVASPKNIAILQL